jgi:hypothetical protein
VVGDLFAQALQAPMRAGTALSGLVSRQFGFDPKLSTDPVVPYGAISSLVPRAYTALGLPEPQSEAERVAAHYAENLGGAAAAIAGSGGAGAIPAITGSLLGTTGSELARRAGLSDRVQMMADVLGNLGPGIATATARLPFALGRAATSAGAARNVAGELLRSAEPTGAAALPQRIAAAPHVGLPGAPRTLAAVTGDPALARVEDALRAMPEGGPIRAVEGQRAQMIADELERMRPRLTPDAGARGERIRTNLNMQEDLLNARTDRLYNQARAARGPGTFSTQPVMQDVGRVAQKYYPAGYPAPPEFRNIAQQIADRGRSATGQWLDAMDRQIGDAQRAARRQGNNTLAAALGEVRDSLGQVTPSPLYDAARAWRARVGRVMGRDQAGANASDAITRTDQFGSPTLSAERVAARAVQDPASVKQVLDAGDLAIDAARMSGDAAAVRTATALADRQKLLLREQFLENAGRKATTPGQATVSGPAGTVAAFANWTPARWQRFWQDNQRVADQIFSPAQRQTLQRISDMMGEDLRVQAAASARGSHTAQRLAFGGAKGNPLIDQIVRDWSNGRISPDSIVGRSLGRIIQNAPELATRLALGAVGHHLFPGGGELAGLLVPHSMFGSQNGRNTLLREMLGEAMADPNRARQLMSNLSDREVQRILGQPGAGWIGNMVRAAARTYIQANQPPPQLPPGMAPPPMRAAPAPQVAIPYN